MYIDYWLDSDYIDYWIEDADKIEIDSTADYVIDDLIVIN